MVPLSFGCGVAVLAAMAILAPSRAARSAIARPMPREAPVMNSVFPVSDIRASLLAREERRERRARLLGVQTFREKVGLGIHLPDDIVNMATQELARHRDRAGGESRDLVRGFERDPLARRGI